MSRMLYHLSYTALEKGYVTEIGLRVNRIGDGFSHNLPGPAVPVWEFSDRV